jgi:hypothetical protein
MNTLRNDLRHKAGTENATQLEIFDVLVQSSTVALFHAYGVAVAPLSPNDLGIADFHPNFPLVGVAFRARAMHGMLVLSLPDTVAGQVRMDSQRDLDGRELLRELGNQALGRLKNRLTQYQVTLACGLPTLFDRRPDFERAVPRPAKLRVYGLRTIHGVVNVAVVGVIDPSMLEYSSTTVLNAEGDIILF